MLRHNELTKKKKTKAPSKNFFKKRDKQIIKVYSFKINRKSKI